MTVLVAGRATQAEDIGSRGIDDSLPDFGGGGRRSLGPEQGSNTSDVRASHGGTADGVGGGLAANPSGSDSASRTEDIDASSPVGEIRALIS